MSAIANQNGHHMVRHVLLLVHIHFHWNLFIFEFLTIFFFYIGDHFENFKNKEHNFEWWSIFVSSFKWIRCTITFFAPWLPWQWPPFWICSTPQNLPHTTVDIPTKFHEVWWKESQKMFNPPFFVSMATAAKFVQPILIFLAYLVPLDVDVVPIKFHQFLFGE